MARHAGAYGISRPRSADFVIVSLPLDADVVAAAAVLAAQPGVVYAQPDPIAVLAYVPNDPLYQYQWNFHRLNMEREWDINRGGDSGLTVAVIDSGLAYIDQGAFRQAPDLAGATFVAPHDFIWDDETPTDLDGHGTHVTGTIGERTGNGIGAAGMAFNVALMPLKAVSGPWDEALGAPNVGTRQHRGRGGPLCGRPRRQRHQHEPRIPGRGRARARRHRLRRRQGRGRGRRGRQQRKRGQPRVLARGLRAVNRRADCGGRRRLQLQSRPVLEQQRVRRGGSAGREPRRGRRRRRLPGWRASGDARSRSGRPRHLQSVRLHLLRGHLDGRAARVGPGSAVDDAWRESAKGSRDGDRTLGDRCRSPRPRQRHRLRRHQPAWRHATASAWPNRGAS